MSCTQKDFGLSRPRKKYVMKISFVEPHLRVFGGIRRIVEIGNHLTEREHDVTIFHSDGSECTWMKCTAKTKPAKDVLQESHDIIIYNDPVALDYRLVKKAEAKVKVFFVLELYRKEMLGQFSPKLLLPWNLRTYYVRKSLRKSYLILCNASWEQEWLKENLDIDTELMIGGINTELFYPIEVEKKDEVFRILYSGDLRKRKGTDTIEQAIKIVQDYRRNVVADTYHGKGIPQNQMAAKYSQANLFVEASWHAGWNNPVAEAMACKVPVVCTDIGGVKDFAVNEQTALLAPVRDAQAIAKAILRMIDDTELRTRLRENAYHKITQFKWDDCIDKLESVLSSSLEKADFNKSYVGQRSDVLKLVPQEVRKVLDVGCSVGTLGASIKKKNSDVKVTGIDADEKMAEMAKERLDKVVVGDVEILSVSEHFREKEFDCIIFADVLEHLRKPWEVLKDYTQILNDDGVVVLSIPNVCHYSTIFSLIFLGRWPYRKRGIHDKSHLRFFTLKNIKEMLDYAGLKTTKVTCMYRLIESKGLGPFNRISWVLGLPIIKKFFTFQYLIDARKK